MDRGENDEDTSLLLLEPPSPRRRVAKWCAVAIVPLVLLVAGGWVWLTHATVFKQYGDMMGGQVRVGDTAYVDVAMYPRPGAKQSVTIDIKDIRPRMLINTSEATVDILACTSIDETTRIGSVRGDIHDYCATVAPWHSGSYTIGSDTYFIAAITPQQEGAVAFDGIDVSFRDGIRSGSQHTGIQTVFVTPYGT